MARSLQRPLPKWLRKAVKHKVLSLEEAQAMDHQFILAVADEEPMPEPLFSACSRIWLYEMRPEGSA